MEKTVQTQKRSALVEDVIASLKENPVFSGIVARKGSEGHFQESLFLGLERELPKVLSRHFGFSKKKSTELVHERFKWETKIDTPVPSFNFFATNHRPDAVLDINNKLRIAIELKKGESGQSLRSGIGQALVYATQFDFTVYVFIDTTPGLDIRSSFKAHKEQALMDSLWNNYNIRFLVI
jgi:hypothetical protein